MIKTLYLLSILVQTVTFSLSYSIIPSWKNTPTQEILFNFINEVSNNKSPRYVEESERIALFDLDGTLLCERPNFLEIQMALESMPHLKKLATNNPKSLIIKQNKEISLDNYYLKIKEFRNKKHPQLQKKYTGLFYKPMIELISYLKEKKFKIYIVTTSEQEFVRGFIENILDIPPENIIGSVLKIDYKNGDLFRGNSWYEPYNEDDNKVIRIRERLGYKRKILMAFGNSFGDQAMLEFVNKKNPNSLSMIIVHDDPKREFSYVDHDLIKWAQKNDIKTISMKNDFLNIFE